MPRHKPRSRARAAAAGGGGGALLLIALILVGGGIPDAEFSTEAVDTCDDGNDNDGDGWIDDEDPECNPLSPSYDGVEDGDA